MHARDDGRRDAPPGGGAMKSLRAARSGFRPAPSVTRPGPPTRGPEVIRRGDLRRPGVGPVRGGASGFSMIELMVVLAVVALLGTAAAVGFRRNEFKSQSTRFIADVEGVIVQARNAAIDRQTQVAVDVFAQQVRVSAWNGETNVFEVFAAAQMVDTNAALLTTGDAVCVYGFTAGAQPPSLAGDIDPPTDCLGGSQRMVFEPDGRLSDPNGLLTATPNAGATLWIADRTNASTPKYAIVQIFPGGLVRTFKDIL
jgi:prepilin-type N-terminal cleavage/methylation domain-containing protein